MADCRSRNVPAVSCCESTILLNALGGADRVSIVGAGSTVLGYWDTHFRQASISTTQHGIAAGALVGSTVGVDTSGQAGGGLLCVSALASGLGANANPILEILESGWVDGALTAVAIVKRYYLSPSGVAHRIEHRIGAPVVLLRVNSGGDNCTVAVQAWTRGD